MRCLQQDEEEEAGLVQDAKVSGDADADAGADPAFTNTRVVLSMSYSCHSFIQSFHSFLFMSSS